MSEPREIQVVAFFQGGFGGFGTHSDFRPVSADDIPLTEDGHGTQVDHPAEGVRMPQVTSQTVDPAPVLAVSSPAPQSPVSQEPEFSYTDDAAALAELI